MSIQRDCQLIKRFISKEVVDRRSNGVVLGLSGGLDSSVTATIAVQALGHRRVLGLIMPDLDVTLRKDIKDAEELAKNLDITYKIIRIDKSKKEIIKQVPYQKYAQGNLASRLRMCILYYYAGITNRLVVGTTDKSELKIGYYTKHGDGAADIFPLADLYKTEVRELGRYLCLPKNITEKKSSPGLWKYHIAEQEIGLSYELVDKILRHLEDNSLSNTDIDSRSVNLIRKFIRKNEHKDERRPVCRLRS
jgi:NAD+ synthase